MKLREIPFATITLIVASLLMFFYEPADLHNWLVDTEIGKLALLLIHPVVHGTFGHLLGNMFGLLILGLLIEAWMTHFARKKRCLIFFGCYLLSLVGSFIGWTTIPVIGASGIISTAMAVALWYYWKFYFQGWSSLAPICIGLAFFPFVSPILDMISKGKLPEGAMLHYWAFFLALILALAIGRTCSYRKQRQLPLRQNTRMSRIATHL